MDHADPYRGARPAPPPGHRGTPAADLGALRELLLRVSRLADDLPEDPYLRKLK